MTLDEKAITFQEEHIPELAQAAFNQAYWRALGSGSSVLVSENGNLVEVYPDGTSRIVKKIPKPTPVIPGQILERP